VPGIPDSPAKPVRGLAAGYCRPPRGRPTVLASPRSSPRVSWGRRVNGPLPPSVPYVRGGLAARYRSRASSAPSATTPRAVTPSRGVAGVGGASGRLHGRLTGTQGRRNEIRARRRTLQMCALVGRGERYRIRRGRAKMRGRECRGLACPRPPPPQTRRHSTPTTRA